MSLFSLVRRLPNPRFLITSIVAIAIGVLTSWATLTGYTANQAHSKSAAVNGTQSEAGKRKQSEKPTLDRNYGKLPLSFEENRGQTGASCEYVARGPGYNIFLTPGEALLVFQERRRTSTESAALTNEPISERGVEPRFHQRRHDGASKNGKEQTTAEQPPMVVRMRLIGANQNAESVEGREELPGKVNYFIGDDSSKWLTAIPTYGSVSYRDVYPGVDLVYYGNGQQLEYDLVVAPGADPNIIKVKFDGAERLRIDTRGDLLLKTQGGEIRQAKPLIYQEINGVRRQIEGRYVVGSGNSVGFKVKRYDRKQPLVIDPRLVYLALVNGSGSGNAITVDGNGFAYLTGRVDDTFLNPTPGALQGSFAGSSDVFVTKLNPSGTRVVFTTYLGGTTFDDGYGIAVDSQGNVYVTGTAGANFPTTPGAFQTVNDSSGDAFVSKLNASGSALVYSTLYGGSDYEEGDGLAVDPTGNAYVAGLTFSSDLITSPGAPQRTNAGGAL